MLCKRYNGLRDPKHDACPHSTHLLSPNRTHPGRLWNFATTSCSIQVHTTPKSAKGTSCSLNSAREAKHYLAALARRAQPWV
jgi:hypothetical protein